MSTTTAPTGAVIHLTPEMAGIVHRTMQAHLLDLGLNDDLRLAEDLGLDGELNISHAANIESMGAKMTLCGRILLQALEHSALPVDDDVLALLARCEAEGERTLKADSGTDCCGYEHPDDVAIAKGRLAQIRTLLAAARDRAGDA